MPITDNLNATTKADLRTGLFGKYKTLATLVGYSLGMNNLNYKIEDPELNFGTKEFFDRLDDKLLGGTVPVRVMRHNAAVHYVVLRKFKQDRDLSVLLKPLVTSPTAPFYHDSGVAFTDLVEAQSFSPKIQVTAASGRVVPATSPDPYKHIGEIFQSGTQQQTASTVATTADEMSMQKDGNDVDFDLGNPPTDGDGVGGLIPIIYRKSLTKLIQFTGDPADPDPKKVFNQKYADFLRYDTGNKPRKFFGKQIFAFKKPTLSAKTGNMAFLINVQHLRKPGGQIDEIRDQLAALGFDYVVGFASDQMTLLYQRIAKHYFHAAPAAFTDTNLMRSALTIT